MQPRLRFSAAFLDYAASLRGHISTSLLCAVPMYDGDGQRLSFWVFQQDRNFLQQLQLYDGFEQRVKASQQ
jgi:hypothetical protein